MAMASYRMDSEEEALFRSYPYAMYFVQSPSTASHANSSNNNYELSTYHSPLQSENLQNPSHETVRLALSRYSSSRGSNNAILHENDTKKSVREPNGRNESNEVDVVNDDDELMIMKNGVNIDHEEDEEGFYEGGEWSDSGWMKYFSLSYSNSGWWICLQLSWRLLFSLMIALIIFFLCTKPPAPRISVQMGRISEFRLGEGVDGSGVATKILSCNCSIRLIIDNKSRVFGLHIQPPIMQIFFGPLPFATSRVGRELYAESNDLTMFRLSVGTRNKPMYGAGRSMQDLLDSGNGLPLIIKLRFKSSFHVVWALFESKFHHQAQCLALLDNKYDKKQKTQSYTSKCVIT